MRPEEAYAHLRSAWHSVIGSEPSPQAVAILWAQWAHETGRGQRMVGNNFGGLKADASSAMSVQCVTREGSGADARMTVARFRAYQSPVEGASDYVRVLATRFPAALEAAQAGDAQAFARALGRAGYFTDSETTYAHSIASLAREASLSTDARATPQIAHVPSAPMSPTASWAVDGLERALARMHDGSRRSDD